MKKTTLDRILSGQFDQNKSIHQTIDSLNKSYSRARETVERMHSNDEITLEESMTREFRYYSVEIQKAKLKEFEDEQKKMTELKFHLTKEFGVDIWDYVILNSKFSSLEDLYKRFEHYSKELYD